MFVPSCLAQTNPSCNQASEEHTAERQLEEMNVQYTEVPVDVELAPYKRYWWIYLTVLVVVVFLLTWALFVSLNAII